MKQKIEAMNDYFFRQIEGCGQREQALRADERKDEAVFERIRANVYDIFRTTLSAAAQTRGEDAQGVQAFFQQRMKAIPAAWETARQEAERYGDENRALLECIKLETAKEIETQFAQTWEVQL